MPDKDLVAAVAQRTVGCAVTVWGFGVGGALAGLVRAGVQLGRPEWVSHVARLVRPSLDAAPDPTDHLIAVEALLELARARPDVDVGPACERWVPTVTGAARPVPGRPQVHRPDLIPWSSTIWVDCMHTDGPALALLGHTKDALTAAEEYAAVLQRGDGLFHHGYDVVAGRGNDVAWGRGQGWALIGMVETLRASPGEPDDGLRRRLGRLVEAMSRHEDDGRWHTIVDDPTSPVEHSIAAYVALGVGRALDGGLIDPSFGPMTDRAWATTAATIAPDGGLEVSEATPVGDASTYRERATGVFPWGQAPVLHAGLDRMEGRTE